MMVISTFPVYGSRSLGCKTRQWSPRRCDVGGWPSHMIITFVDVIIITVVVIDIIIIVNVR